MCIICELKKQMYTALLLEKLGEVNGTKLKDLIVAESGNGPISEIYKSGFTEAFEGEGNLQLAVQTTAEKLLAALQPKPQFDSHTAKFIGHLMYDLTPYQCHNLGEHLKEFGTLPSPADHLFTEWDGKDLTEKQVAPIAATL